LGINSKNYPKHPSKTVQEIIECGRKYNDLSCITKPQYIFMNNYIKTLLIITTIKIQRTGIKLIILHKTPHTSLSMTKDSNLPTMLVLAKIVEQINVPQMEEK
jgi:hypothetical protein